MYRFFSKTALASVLATSAFITGCASLGIGESEFACPGRPDGVKCMSAWDVYDNTHNGNIPQSNVNSDGEAVEQGGSSSNNTVQADDFVIDNYVTPRLPDKSVPVRTPAKVMRIWIAPYEDDEGNFHAGGYIYKEIEPRKWTLGVTDVKGAERRVFELNKKH